MDNKEEKVRFSGEGLWGRKSEVWWRWIIRKKKGGLVKMDNEEEKVRFSGDG